MSLAAAIPTVLPQHKRPVPPGKQIEEPEPRPGNVLVLIADDLGVDQLAAYGVGTDLPPTPHLDQMASEGVLFRNAWSQPTCSPTRATIQTGRYGFRTTIGSTIAAFGDGPALSLGEITLPEMLDLGTSGRYAHAMIGKWHLGTSQVGGDLAPNLAGYGHFSGSVEGQIRNYFGWRKVVNGAVTTSTQYATSACVDDALDWIGQQSGNWLCVVGFQAPHAPFHAPPASLHNQDLDGLVPTCEGTPRPFYKAMIQALDAEIGRLLASIPAAELAWTTVFFLGDNGSEWCVRVPPSGRSKSTLYQGGIAVPLIASGYGVGSGESQALVCTADLFATIAELAGVDLSATFPDLTLDSVSFAGCLAQPGAGEREWMYAETFSSNGPGQPAPLPGCPGLPVCQQDLGLDGPGSVVLASCGDPLYGAYGNHLVPWQVTGGPPLTSGWLRIGAYLPAFDPGLGAWVVSSSAAFTQPFQLDASGAHAATSWTGDASLECHYQVVVVDAAQPQGFAVSNALRMDFLPTHMRAVRDGRYKLIRSDPCDEELYDLALDPLELLDILQRPMSTAEIIAHLQLSARLDALP